MLLTKQQRYILEVLDKLGSLRREQLTALICAKFCPQRPDAAEKMTDALLRQLRYGNAPVRMENGMVSRPDIRAGPYLGEAVDVMLELSSGALLDFDAKLRPPVLLRFATDGKRIALFAVLSAEAVLSPLATIPAFDPTERVILLQTGGEAPTDIPIPNKCFLAVRREDGTHRFFELNTKL